MKRKMISGFILCLVSSLLLGFGLMNVGCATTYTNPNLKLSNESEYYDTLDRYTEKKQVYDALYQTMEFSSSFLNTSVMKYQLDQNARIYQWNLDQYSNEKSKIESNLSKHTEIFLSFYTPERKNDDLNKVKTKWKVFLDANGKRFEGKVEKIKSQYAEILSLYHQHNRWSTPYRITFDVPTSIIEGAIAKLTLTGPVGSATVDFKPLDKVTETK